MTAEDNALHYAVYIVEDLLTTRSTMGHFKKILLLFLVPKPICIDTKNEARKRKNKDLYTGESIRVNISGNNI